MGGVVFNYCNKVDCVWGHKCIRRIKYLERMKHYKRQTQDIISCEPEDDYEFFLDATEDDHEQLPEKVEISVSEHQEQVQETVVLSDEKMTEWLEYVKTRKCYQCMYFVPGKDKIGRKRSCRCKIGHTPVAYGAACNDYDENYVNIPVVL